MSKYPDQTLLIGNQLQIQRNGVQHSLALARPQQYERPNTSTQSTECLAQAISASDFNGLMLDDLLPIPKEFSYARQIEVYAEIGRIIEAK